LVGKMSPANIFNMVDLPEPEGPTIANFSPSLSFKIILFIIFISIFIIISSYNTI